MSFEIPEDPRIDPRYTHGVISFLSPQGPQRADDTIVRFSGAFESEQEAREHAEAGAKNESDLGKTPLNRYVVELNKFILVPQPSDTNSQTISLASVVENYLKELKEKNEHFEERRRILRDEKRDIDPDFFKEFEEQQKQKQIEDASSSTSSNNKESHFQTNKGKGKKGGGGGNKRQVYPYDQYKVRLQEYVVMSYIPGPTIDNQQYFAIAFGTPFEKLETAMEEVEKVRKLEDRWQRYVVNMYEFLALPPPPNDKIPHYVRGNEILQEMITEKAKAAKRSQELQREVEREQQQKQLENK